METDGNLIWKSSKFVSEFANTDISNVIKVNLALGDYEIEKYERPFKLGTGNINYINEYIIWAIFKGEIFKWNRLR